jgi:hypothetical protein
MKNKQAGINAAAWFYAQPGFHASRPTEAVAGCYCSSLSTVSSERPGSRCDFCTGLRTFQALAPDRDGTDEAYFYRTTGRWPGEGE